MKIYSNSIYNAQYIKQNSKSFRANIKIDPEILKKVQNDLNSRALLTSSSLLLLGSMHPYTQRINNILGEETEENIWVNSDTYTISSKSTDKQEAEIEHPQKLSDNELKEHIQEDLNNGKPLHQIAKELNIPQSQIQKIKKSLGIKKMSPEEIQHYNLHKMISSSPEKQKYLSILTKFPELSAKYKQLLINSVTDKDEKQIETLNTLEEIFKTILNQHKNLKDTYSSFASINDCYADDIENLCINFNTNKKYGTEQKFLSRISSRAFTSKDLEKWAQFNNLSYEEFHCIKNMNPDIIAKIAEIKNSGRIKSFYVDKMKDERFKEQYIFSLKFPENKTLDEKLKTIIDFHEAIHGPIKLEKKDTRKVFKPETLIQEFYYFIKNDKMLESMYNFIKFIEPEALKDYNLESDEVKNLEPTSSEYKKLKADLYNATTSIDIYNPKLVKMVDALNNQELFGDLLLNPHAKLRFLSRIVLKDNPNANLEEEIKEKREILEKVLEFRIDNNGKIFPHTLNGNYTPTLFLGNTILGEYIIIGLHEEANIHTIYSYTKEYMQQMKNNPNQ